MKLKYYLRGLGMGILFATIVMTVSSIIHNNNLSEEKIIEEAKKLGMVMPEESEDKHGLWGDSKGDTESDTSISGTEDSQNPEDSQLPADSQIPADSQAPEDSQATSETQEVTYIEIRINAKDSATKVGEILYNSGLVDSADNFREYLKEMGYTHVIRAGTFQIPVGATYEEICEIIVNLRWLENNRNSSAIDCIMGDSCLHE